MEKGKLALVVGSGLVLAIGIGVAIYYGTKKNVDAGSGNTGGGSGGGSGSGSPNVTVGGMSFNLQQVQDALKSIGDATKEKFPLRVGMFGPNIKSMQTALRSKFNQLNVASNGVFDLKTATALKNIKYITLLENTIDDDEFLDIIDGKTKTLSANGELQQGDVQDFWNAPMPSGNYQVI